MLFKSVLADFVLEQDLVKIKRLRCTRILSNLTLRCLLLLFVCLFCFLFVCLLLLLLLLFGGGGVQTLHWLLSYKFGKTQFRFAVKRNKVFEMY